LIDFVIDRKIGNKKREIETSKRIITKMISLKRNETKTRLGKVNSVDYFQQLAL